MEGASISPQDALWGSPAKIVLDGMVYYIDWPATEQAAADPDHPTRALARIMPAIRDTSWQPIDYTPSIWPAGRPQDWSPNRRP